MVTNAKQMDEKIRVKRYKIRHSIDEYTFPKEAYIHDVKFDENFIRVELTDRRKISIPLWWIPTIYNAPMEDREKFELNQNRTMIVWDPEKCDINDEISITDYLGPARNETRAVDMPRKSNGNTAEAKTKLKKK